MVGAKQYVELIELIEAEKYAEADQILKRVFEEILKGTIQMYNVRVSVVTTPVRYPFEKPTKAILVRVIIEQPNVKEGVKVTLHEINKVFEELRKLANYMGGTVTNESVGVALDETLALVLSANIGLKPKEEVTPKPKRLPVLPPLPFAFKCKRCGLITTRLRTKCPRCGGTEWETIYFMTTRFRTPIYKL